MRQILYIRALCCGEGWSDLADAVQDVLKGLDLRLQTAPLLTLLSPTQLLNRKPHRGQRSANTTATHTHTHTHKQGCWQTPGLSTQTKVNQGIVGFIKSASQTKPPPSSRHYPPSKTHTHTHTQINWRFGGWGLRPADQHLRYQRLYPNLFDAGYLTCAQLIRAHKSTQKALAASTACDTCGHCNNGHFKCIKSKTV